MTSFPFRRQSSIAGLCIFIVLLFGGVTVKQNSITLGTTSCHAITVSPPPAKAKVARKTNWLQKRITNWVKRAIGEAI